MAQNTPQANPHQIRVAARQSAYPNQATETAAVSAVDEAVWAHVRRYEQMTVEQSRSMIAERKADEAKAVEAITALRAQIVRPLNDGAAPDAAMAKEFQQYRLHAESIKSDLRRAQADAESLMERNADIYGSLVKTWEKYPMLRPVIH
jgi:hypothetical protein